MAVNATDDEAAAQVGVSHPHESARLHVSGRAPYTDDLPEWAGTLHAALGLSPVARIVSHAVHAQAPEWFTTAPVGAIEKAQGLTSTWQPLAELTATGSGPLLPPMATLQILGGRKEKIRAGDVLGALTKDMGFASAQIGKISVNEFSTYVAVERGIAAAAERKLNAGKVKGRSVKVRLLQGQD